VNIAPTPNGIAPAGSVSPLLVQSEPATVPSLTIESCQVDTNSDSTLTGYFTVNLKIDFYLENLSGNETDSMNLRIYYVDSEQHKINLPVNSIITALDSDGKPLAINPWSINPTVQSAGSLSSNAQFSRTPIVLPQDPSKTQTQVTATQLSNYQTALNAVRHFTETVQIQVPIYGTVLPAAIDMVNNRNAAQSLGLNADLTVVSSHQSAVINTPVMT
jgi:hypothetical protein